MQTLGSIIAGGVRLASHPRLLLPLYVCSLLLGLLQTWPLGIAVARGALRNPFLDDLAGGGTDALANLFIANPQWFATVGLWSVVLLGLGGVFGLLYNFFAGGILSVYAGARPFWSGCRRYFWTFTGLGVVLMLLALLLVVVLLILRSLLGNGVTLALALVLLQLVNVLGEYARALAVVRDRRNPAALLAAAGAFCLPRIPGVLLLALVGLLLHAGLLAVYRLGAGALGASPLVVAWQQLAVLAFIWIKLLRLAWAVRYTQLADPATPRHRSSAALTTPPSSA